MTKRGGVRRRDGALADARPSGGGYHDAEPGACSARASRVRIRFRPQFICENLRNLCSNPSSRPGGRCNACGTKIDADFADSIRVAVRFRAARIVGRDKRLSADRPMGSPGGALGCAVDVGDKVTKRQEDKAGEGGGQGDR